MSATAWKPQFKDNMQHAIQQQGSNLRMCMDTASDYAGEGAQVVDLIGAGEAQFSNGRDGDTPIRKMEHAQRWLFPQDWEDGTLVVKEDKLRMLSDPTSKYFENIKNAMIRFEQNRIIIPSFFAPAMTGKTGQAQTLFPPTNIIPIGTGGNNFLNVAKVKLVRQLMIENEVNPDEQECFFGITALDEAALLNDPEIKSTQFVLKPAISASGTLLEFLGFKFKRLQTWEIGDAGGGLFNNNLPVWCKDGMHFGIWDDMRVEAAKRPDKKFNWQIYVEAHAGATRLEERKVFQVPTRRP
jgi:hypothetical protein